MPKTSYHLLVFILTFHHGYLYPKHRVHLKQSWPPAAAYCDEFYYCKVKHGLC